MVHRQYINIFIYTALMQDLMLQTAYSSVSCAGTKSHYVMANAIPIHDHAITALLHTSIISASRQPRAQAGPHTQIMSLHRSERLSAHVPCPYTYPERTSFCLTRSRIGLHRRRPSRLHLPELLHTSDPLRLVGGPVVRTALTQGRN